MRCVSRGMRNVHLSEEMLLSDSRVHLLRVAVKRYAPELLPLVTRQAKELPLEQRNALRSALGDYLTNQGVDPNWDPTELGRDLEELIDELGPR